MSERLRGKTFVLGIGAQKAGTSWLYRYLRSRPDVYMSPIKELHYFDQIYRPDLCGKFSRQFNVWLARRILEMAKEEQIADRPDIVNLVDRVRMNYDRDAYLEFFADRVPESVMVAGEVTPSYSLIGEQGFSEIRRLFEREGVSLKIVFLLRDPTERYYSGLRMLQRTRRAYSAAQLFFEQLDNPQFYERGLYHVTLQNLRASFPPSDVHIAFYETLFNHPELERLCRFLGLDYSVRADLSKRINESPGETMTEEMLAAALERFAAVYDFCRAEFGDALPSSWHGRSAA